MMCACSRMSQGVRLLSFMMMRQLKRKSWVLRPGMCQSATPIPRQLQVRLLQALRARSELHRMPLKRA